MNKALKIITKTLHKGNTSVSFTDNMIGNDSVINVYTDVNIPPTSATQNGHTINLVFDKQGSDIGVAITISNSDIDIPTLLSELVTDENHRTVTDEQIALWNEGGSGGSEVLVSPTYSGGTNIATINVDGEDYDINAPTPDNISLYGAPITDPKIQIASFVKNGVSTPIYAPTGGSGGVTSYNDLSNKPKINNTELNGNKSLDDLGVMPINPESINLSKEGYGNSTNITYYGIYKITHSFSGDIIEPYITGDDPSGNLSYDRIIYNRPQINSIELVGNKTLDDLGIASKEELEGISDLLDEINGEVV